MICPQCGNSVVQIEPIVVNLTICQTCLRSLVVIDADNARLAVSADTIGLNDLQLAKIRIARKAAREANV